MLISVIIPVKNGVNYLHEAIEGIKKQDCDMEIIVVDDASDDNTVQIAESMGCTVIKHETTKGQIAGKNTGLRAAAVEFIMFHDHDDIMNEGALQQLCEAFDEDTQVVAAKVRTLSRLSFRSKQVPREDAYYGLLTGCTLIKKDVFDTLGFFDESIKTGETVDFFMRLKDKNINTKKLDIIAANRRIHDTNLGKTAQKQEFKDYASVLRAKLAGR
jgi:glycosyltransferase involved in cell wall biosynthesis